MATFDGEALIMTLDAPTAGALTQNVQDDWYEQWKLWMLDGNMRYPPLFFDSFGGNDLTPGVKAGAYFVFQNTSGWRIRSSEADQTVYVVGNVAPADSSLPMIVPTIGAYTVLFDGLQPITQNIDTITETLEIATFIGKEGVGITIDPTIAADPVAGGSIIPGNRRYPVKTEAFMHERLTELGMKNVYAKTSISLTVDHSDGHAFYGDNPQTVVVTIGDVATYPLKDVSGCKFQDCYITGELDSANIVWESIVAPITNANGFIYKCTIVGPIVVGGTLSMEDCWTATPGTDNIIDFNSVANTVALTDWSGGTILVKNMIAGCIFGMGGTAGSLKLDSTCTGGAVNHGGAIRIKEDLSTGVTINDASTATQVWEREIESNGNVTAEQAMRIGLAAMAGEVSISGNVITFKTPDGAVDRMVSTTTATGERTGIVLSP